MIEMRRASDSVAIDDEIRPMRVLLVLLWTFLTVLWSIFTPPHKTFAARVLLFQPLWPIRVYLADAHWIQDLILFLSLHAVYNYCTGVWRLLTLDDLTRVDLNSHVLLLYIQIFSLLGGCGALAGGIVHRGHQLKSEKRSERLPDERIDEQLLPPLLIPSRTTHSRLFPQKHSFSYSYLLVGIPVGVRGRVGNALSIDSQERSWFHINSNDYLARGHTSLGLAEKLKHYLHTQNITDRDYTFAYLVTAPRLFAYSFNPVSFWYLYDSDTKLKYMILEVNNTFDERRMYLLGAHIPEQNFGLDMLGPSANGWDESSKTLDFTETFEKDFHVSPFNSRKGTYSMRAKDPLAAYEETGEIRIDNTIVLRSSKESAKVVARIWSEGRLRPAAHISRFDLARFIASWWWVGFATFPRIVWEARTLFFRRTLHVWYRPEVVETSIGRVCTDDEKRLEIFFRAFLEHAVRHANRPLRLIYHAAHNEEEKIVLYSPSFTYEEDQQQALTLMVTSPALYSRFVHYAHAKEAFDRECLATDEKNRTLVIKNAGQLPVLVDAIHRIGLKGPSEPNLLEQVRWSWLRRLRCPPSEASYPRNESSDVGYTITDIRSLGDSELDNFVKHYCKDAGIYQQVAIKLFLAQRFAFGIPMLISVFDWLVRAISLVAAMYYAGHSNTIDILRPRKFEAEDIRSVAASLILANAVHFWSLVKG